MTDYISREALPGANTNDNDYADGWNECLEAIEAIPAADVRPVVLCKDCLNEDCAMYHGPNWFCADGEKREER